MTITNFSIEYDAINSKNIFTNGDTINGRIIVEVSKETKVQDLMFIASGRAQVYWSEHYGQYDTRHYWAEEKYYEVKQHILRQLRGDGSDIISEGRHVFPFTFQIPDRKMPSSFKDRICKIVHKVKAELHRSMRFREKAKQHFTFVSGADLDIPGLMDPQYGCKDKTVSLFGSGSITMDVHTDKMGYIQGEGIMVKIEINNKSSRSVEPKFVLYRKKSSFAQGHRNVETKDVLKDKMESVPSGSKEVVKQVITIPDELPSSITNCPIFKLEYRLKVILDVKYATDPKIKLPIVVMPALKSIDPGKKQPSLDMCGSLQPNQPFGIPNQAFAAPPGGYPHQPYPYPTPPIGNPCQPHALLSPPFGSQAYAWPTVPSITSPVGPPPAYSASGEYPPTTDKPEDKLQ
ncbi:arrestin domain-containing protein 3-like [Synchiropus picturatus]